MQRHRQCRRTFPANRSLCFGDNGSDANGNSQFPPAAELSADPRWAKRPLRLRRFTARAGLPKKV